MLEDEPPPGQCQLDATASCPDRQVCQEDAATGATAAVCACDDEGNQTSLCGCMTGPQCVGAPGAQRVTVCQECPGGCLFVESNTETCADGCHDGFCLECVCDGSCHTGACDDNGICLLNDNLCGDYRCNHDGSGETGCTNVRACRLGGRCIEQGCFGPAPAPRIVLTTQLAVLTLTARSGPRRTAKPTSMYMTSATNCVSLVTLAVV